MLRISKLDMLSGIFWPSRADILFIAYPTKKRLKAVNSTQRTTPRLVPHFPVFTLSTDVFYLFFQPLYLCRSHLSIILIAGARFTDDIH